MSVDSTNNNHKYFCKRCKDQNYLIECKCGQCNEVIFLRGKNFRIRNYMRYHHCKLQNKGINSIFWKGGRQKRSNYWVLNMPDYFSADKYGIVPEHIYFYQEYYQCCMLPWGEVHHKDPVREGWCLNMIWNLQGMTRRQHIIYHNKIDMSGRRCSRCGTDKTYIMKNGTPEWGYINGELSCKKCCDKEYRINKKKVTISQ